VAGIKEVNGMPRVRREDCCRKRINAHATTRSGDLPRSCLEAPSPEAPAARPVAILCASHTRVDAAGRATPRSQHTRHESTECRADPSPGPLARAVQAHRRASRGVLVRLLRLTRDEVRSEVAQEPTQDNVRIRGPMTPLTATSPLERNERTCEIPL